MKAILILGAVVVAGGLAVVLWPGADAPTPGTASGPGEPGGPLAEVIVPDVLSANAQMGKVAFDVKCSACHGAAAAGQDGVAPPLVHRIYEPGHHGDEAFQRAAASGVTSHHWPFGNMPPIEQITRADVTMITAYIRELQQANGIN